jgi:dolichyl-diphosphooligosaccharide--protein glycosyltransferase
VKDKQGLISTAMVPNERGYRSTISRLQYFRGSGGYFNNKYYPPYRRYRLRYISESEEIKIYEYVKGAVIFGRDKPNHSVKLSLNINIANSEFVYYDSLNTGEDGNFTFTVPYPATDDNPYLIRTHEKERSVTISEESVIQGDTFFIKL